VVGIEPVDPADPAIVRVLGQVFKQLRAAAAQRPAGLGQPERGWGCFRQCRGGAHQAASAFAVRARLAPSRAASTSGHTLLPHMRICAAFESFVPSGSTSMM
jgi:hypothetical protein